MPLFPPLLQHHHTYLPTNRKLFKSSNQYSVASKLESFASSDSLGQSCHDMLMTAEYIFAIELTKPHDSYVPRICDPLRSLCLRESLLIRALKPRATSERRPEKTTTTRRITVEHTSKLHSSNVWNYAAMLAHHHRHKTQHSYVGCLTH